MEKPNKGEASLKTPSEYLAKKREQEMKRKASTLTQLFSKENVSKLKKKEKEMINKRMVDPLLDGNLEEYDPEKNYGLYKTRKGQKPNHGHCLHFACCADCLTHDCSLCNLRKIEEILDVQEDEVNRRAKIIATRTMGYRQAMETVDEEWLRVQDPVYASIVDNNIEAEEDLVAYVREAEEYINTLKEKFGIFTK